MVNTINPAECDRTTVYTGECRNFQDTEWITFDSGRRRSPNAPDGNTWLIDVAYGSFWMRDDRVRNLVRLVPARPVTRQDLPSATALREHLSPDVRPDVIPSDFRPVLDAVVEHLNENFPKGEPVRMGRAANNMLRETLARVERDRDEWKARAEAAEGVNHDQARLIEATRAWADEWKARAEAAEARTTPAVTRDEIAQVLERTDSDTSHGDEVSYTDMADAVLTLFGVEAEQTADPVEEKARELYRAATPDARWETVADEYRRIAAHVLEQEDAR